MPLLQSAEPPVESPADGWTESDPGIKQRAKRLDDLGISKRVYPHVKESPVGPIALSEIRERLGRAIRGRGFHLTLDYQLPVVPPAAGAPPRLGGLLVGERRVHVDRGRSLQAAMQGFPSLGVGALVFVASALLLPSIGLWALLALALGVLLFLWGLGRVAAIDSFDSEILFARYAARIPASVGAPSLAASAPWVFDVKVGAGIVATSNRRGKSRVGRSVRRVLAGSPTLEPLPNSLVRELTDF